MKNYILNLNTVNKVKKFVDITSNYTCDIDIIRGRYIIDAKSILGIFSLDLSVPIQVYIHSDDSEVLHKFSEEMNDFI